MSTIKDQTKINKKMKKVVFISLVLDLLAFTMILPLLPSLLEHYSKNDSSGLYWYVLDKVTWFQQKAGVPDRYNTVLFGGLLGSIFSFLQFTASPIIGSLSDIYGRKPVLILSMFGTALSHAMWAVSSNFLLFVIARIIGGISKGNISLSTAIMTDISSKETRGKCMALIGVAFSIGFIFGPMIGAGFVHWSHSQIGQWYVMPALFALLLTVIDIVYLITFLRETLPLNKRTKSAKSSITDAVNYISPRSLFKFKAVKVPKKDHLPMQRIGFVLFLFLFLYSGLEYTLTFLTHLRFQYTSMQQGKMFLVVGIVMATIQGGFVRRIKPGKEKMVALVGVALTIPAFITIGLAPTTPILYCGLIMYAMASAIVVPCLTTMISIYGMHDQKGTVMGIFRSLGALARSLGPAVAAFAFWSFGATMTYIIGGSCLLLPLIILRNL